MDRGKELVLLEESLELTRGKRPFMEADEARVPVARYVDAERFELEREVLFRRQLNLVSHGSELASPGDFVTLDVVGTPAILVRDDAGRARAFVNVCRHRGATVELRDRGRCNRFVCPYHAWTYRTDGVLDHVRHRDGFPSLASEQLSLAELSCVEAGGFLWVCPDPERRFDDVDAPTRAVLDELEGLGCGDAAAFDGETRTWRANWKLIVDGGLESYHIRIAHQDTIGGFFGDNTSSFELVGDHVRSILPRMTILELADHPRDHWRLRDHTNVLYFIHPNVFLLVQQRHFELILFDPVAPDETRIRILTVAPHPGPDGFSDKASRFLADNHAFTKRTLAEDFVLAEQIQRGLNTGVNDHFRLARFEGALTRWHERLEARLDALAGGEPSLVR